MQSFFLLFPAAALYPQTDPDFYDSFFGSLDFLESKNTGLTTFPLLNIPAGGRREALGTAFTALSDDSTYLESNPGAGAMLEFTELSIFHNNLIADVNLESLFFTIREGNLGFGAGGKFLYVPFTAYGSRGEQQASAMYSEGVLTLNGAATFFRDFNFGGLGVGLNAKLAFRSIPETLYEAITGVAGTDQSAVGVMFDVGLLARFNLLKFYTAREKNFSFGAALLNLGPDANDEPLPTRFVGGFSYKPFRFMVLNTDVIVPLRFDDPSLAELPGFAAGLDFTLTNFLSLQSGFLLYGANPRLSVGVLLQLDLFNIQANYVLDRTTQIGKIDRLSVQLQLNLGDQGRKTLSQRVDDLYLLALTALSNSNYLEVIEYCRQALELDPGFTPAAETLTIAQESYRLELELERLREAN